MNAAAKQKSVQDLNDELFFLVQRYQGRAFISDGMGAMDKKRFFASVRGALRNNKLASGKMASFLRKYDEF